MHCVVRARSRTCWRSRCVGQVAGLLAGQVRGLVLLGACFKGAMGCGVTVWHEVHPS